MMARIRTIKPEFFKHEELFELEKQTKLPVRIAFIGLWTVADREGRFKWRPNQLKLDCLPYDSVDFSRVLDALASRGFITEYCEADVDDAEKYGFINTFLQNQVINNRETESLLPSPFDACMTRDPRDLCKSKGKGKEGKGKEGKGAPDNVPDCPHEKIIELYANHLPMLTQVKQWTEARSDSLRARWRENKKHQSLEFWDRYFKYVSESDFLTGRNGKWTSCDMAWLIKQENFVKVLEGKYHGSEA